jgi:nickel-type superoxide dismutase maturation protease
MRPRAVLAPLLAVAAGAVARRWLDVVEVRGLSMIPTLAPGDRLVVARLRPRVGDVVLAADPRDARRELVKRVEGINGDRVTLRGDNPVASTDARTFGSIPAAEVRWRVAARYWPPRRIGRLPAAPPLVDLGGEAACKFPQALIAGD